MMGRTGGSGGPNTSVTAAYEDTSESAANKLSVDDATLTAWKNYGVGLSICRDSEKAVAKTTNPADFVAFPSDPGDGSVLRIVQPDSAEEREMGSAFTNQYTVASFTAATNTVIDLGGVPFYASSVTGFPTVVNSDIPAWLAGTSPNITVRTGWTAPADGLAAGGAFTVTDGMLTFADGVTLTVPDSRSLRDTRGGSLTVATASEGIDGMPTLVFEEGDKRGFLRKSDDGKSLLLTVVSGMAVIFR